MEKYSFLVTISLIAGCSGSPDSRGLFEIYGCESDKDCKGDRICEENVCTDPGFTDSNDSGKDDGYAVNDGGLDDSFVDADEDINDSGVSDVLSDNSSCEPVTCEEFEKKYNGKACGDVPDGCGGFIGNCGGECDATENPYAACGVGLIDSGGNIYQKKDNICGGACVLQKDDACKYSTSLYTLHYKCTHDVGQLQNKSCLKVTGTSSFCCKE